MTLADRMEQALLELGPLPACTLATTIRKRKSDVRAMLDSDPRFVHVGSSRDSRWEVREASLQDDQDGVGHRPSFTVADLGRAWHCSETMARTFLFEDGGFLDRGFMESVDGNGRVRVTELGIRTSLGIAEMRTS